MGSGHSCARSLTTATSLADQQVSRQICAQTLSGSSMVQSSPRRRW